MKSCARDNFWRDQTWVAILGEAQMLAKLTVYRQYLGRKICPLKCRSVKFPHSGFIVKLGSVKISFSFCQFLLGQEFDLVDF